jgi:hypothetical protein
LSVATSSRASARLPRPTSTSELLLPTVFAFELADRSIPLSYITDWIRQLVSLFDDRAPEVVGAAWMAVDALVKTVEKEDMEQVGLHSSVSTCSLAD